MRFIIFSLLALLVATTLPAQKFEVGLNGGIGYNTNPAITTDYNAYETSRAHSPVSPVVALKTILNISKWQCGLETGYMQLSYRGYANDIFVPDPFPIWPYKPSLSTVLISKTAIPVKLFVNRKLVWHRLEAYGGISAGYLLATKCEDPNALAQEYYDHVNGNGFTAGLQLGGTYFISKRVGINAEIGGEFINLTVGDATYRLFAFPGTIGIRYKL